MTRAEATEAHRQRVMELQAEAQLRRAVEAKARADATTIRLDDVAARIAEEPEVRRTQDPAPSLPGAQTGR